MTEIPLKSRSKLVPWRLVVAAAVVVGVFMFALGAVFAADRVARDSAGNTAHFTELPCTDPAVVARLDPRLVGEYRAAVVDFGGERYAACYTDTGESFFLVYEDGDKGVVPHKDLLPNA